MLIKLFVMPIRVYQKFISPCFAPKCRFYPSCSNYALQAITRHGAIKGILMGSWRLLRCNPYTSGGFDPVPEHWLDAFKKHDYDFYD